MPIIPDDMTPDQRLSEITAILAKGIIRLGNLSKANFLEETSQTPKDSLDVSPTKSLHVRTG